MSRILFYLLIKPISLLPYRALYGLSDALYGLVYHVFGYRKKVVQSNLQRVFPEKSEAKRKEIERGFYHHLCDLVVESIKMFSLSEKELRKRSRIRNPEVLDRYAAQGRSVIVVAGHYNSWELMGAGSDLQLQHQTVGAYTKIQNPFFDRKIKESRSRHGLMMIPVREVRDFFASYQQPMVMLFAGDQSPRRLKNVHWTSFLGTETAVMTGTERYARQYDYPVVFGHMYKVKRGYYEAEFELITDTPSQTAEGEITEAHTRILERDICHDPQYWLWSHKRWKHQKRGS
jgi:Kdo2-lipid IVA lauroyltransferase/acyltransferase